jgi:tetracycline resistance efflux pump
LLEYGGGLITLLRRLLVKSKDPFWAKTHREKVRTETALMGLGFLCFFDGLANSMVVGRVGRRLAAKAGTSPVKLAYIADTTSSAVACVALISTWIAFQLSMIAEAFAAVGQDVNPYQVFLRSIPLNFYCWFALVLLAVAIRRQFHPGPMGDFARTHIGLGLEQELPSAADAPPGPARSALVPLATLIGAFLAGFVLLGTPGPLLPLTRDKLVAAFGSDQGPLVMVLAAALAGLTAFALYPRKSRGGWRRAGRAYRRGLTNMLLPLLILLAAWMLGSVVKALGTAALLAGWAEQVGSLALFPTLVFVTGATVSFATGTSWGTMGLLFPLLVPAGAQLGADQDTLVLVVAAIFSGAVFGDHCSPFSDTTIVTSVSCGVEPHDHVRTQLPYAFIAAGVALALGFLPAGFGFPGWLSLLIGAGALTALPWLARLRKPKKNMSSFWEL